MKKLLMLISLCLSLSFGFVTWRGDSGVYNITTGYDSGLEKSGYWFNYDDSENGGLSKITWPKAKGNGYDDNALDSIIEYCKGVCGTFELNEGTLTYKPFVGIGFNIAGENDEAADVTEMGGICITYSVDVAASIELGLGKATDDEIGYDNPFVKVPASVTTVTQDFAWSSFKQGGWGSKTITGTEAATKLVALKFKIQDVTGTTGSFNIQAIGAKGACNNSTTPGTSEDLISIKPLQIKLNINDSYNVYDINGNLIGKNKTKSELKTMPKGMYIINSGTNNYKFIVK